MKTSFESDRLLYRELLPSDAVGLYELDSNPEVHRYLGNNPVKKIEQCTDYIAEVHRQYQEYGIGRWAVILKETGEFIGWAGLKVEHEVNGHEQFYDLGYRFIQKHWGNGYGYESASAFVEFGFNELKIPVINAYCDADHLASRRVLEKVGMQLVNFFLYEGVQECWYEIRNPQTNSAL